MANNNITNNTTDVIITSLNFNTSLISCDMQLNVWMWSEGLKMHDHSAMG